MFAAIKTSDELHEMNVSVDDQGTTFTSPTLQRVLSATLQLMLGLTLLAWGYQGTGSTWPSDGFARLFIVLLLSMGTTLVSYGVFKVYDLKNPAFIRLDPSGIRFRQGIRSNRFVAWDDIDRIPPGMLVRNTASYAPSAYVYPRNSRKLIPPPSLGASDNGFRLTNLMVFYWQNPQRRDELTNGHVLQRLQAGEFEPGVEVQER
jgi:hypothetical protein